MNGGDSVLHFAHSGKRMAVRSQGRAIVRFGNFEIDLNAGELRQKGVKIKLQEQPFRILAALLEYPGEIVTREHLQQRVWASDTFVDFK
jgi:DNA-binding response OmpR family regulator